MAPHLNVFVRHGPLLDLLAIRRRLENDALSREAEPGAPSAGDLAKQVRESFATQRHSWLRPLTCQPIKQGWSRPSRLCWTGPKRGAPNALGNSRGQRSGWPAGSRAIKAYDELARQYAKSPEADYARLALPRLHLGVDTGQRRFFCLYD